MSEKKSLIRIKIISRLIVHHPLKWSLVGWLVLVHCGESDVDPKLHLVGSCKLMFLLFRLEPIRLLELRL